MSGSIFKQYDIRGKYPEEINENIAFLIGQACASKFKTGKIIVAYDVRNGGISLAESLINGLENMNLGLNKAMKIVPIGYATTPMFYFLVNHLKASGGAMITASHNPKEYNGIKIVGPKAATIPGLEIGELLSKSPAGI
jgi:phosphomannomutase